MINKTFLNNDSILESKNMKHKQKLTKGGFKMKPTRFLIVALVLMGLVATASAATQAGTVIENQAFGNYEDANGNTMPQVESLIVQTTVSQVAGVSLGGNLANPVSAMDSTLYAVTLANSGNYEDTFTIGATGLANDGGTYDFFVYHDANASGTIDGVEGDTEITSSGLVAFTGSYDLLIKVVDMTSGGGNPGEEHVVTLTATSVFDVDSTATITLTTTVQAATVTGVTTIVGDATPAPGESITYESCFTNSGSETAYNGVFVSTMPGNTTLDLTSVSIDGGSAVTIVSTALAPIPADLPYHYNTATDVLTLELGDLISTPGSNEICVQFSAILDDPLAAGVAIDFPAGSPEFTYENFGGDPYPGTVPTEDPGTFPAGGVEVDQAYGVTLADAGVNAPYTYIGDPGDTLIFDFTVTNDGNGLDNFDFSETTDYVTWVYYLDSDQNGILSAGEKTAGAITVTGDLTSGQVVYYIAIGTIPVGTGDTLTDATTIIATSQGAAAEAVPSVVTGSDTNGTTCTAPVLTLVKSVLPAGNQPPGTELTYTIIVANSGTGVATTVVVSDAIPTNTTYVAESMTVDATADGDAVDDISPATDDHAFKAASSVLYDFDTIPAVTAGDDTDMHTLTFKVTID